MKFAQFFRFLVVLFAGSSFLLGGGFIAPAEGPVPFRRDKIPLEVEEIAKLSNQLKSLVQGLDPTFVEHRRAAAQMLALAMALDPSNTSARELVTDLQLGTPLPTVQADEVRGAQAAIWQNLEWLKTPEAGASANALARCLTDVIVVSDPQHDGAEALRDAGETGEWNRWVSNLAAFEKKDMAPEEMPLPNLEPLEAPPEEAPLALAGGELPAILWTIPDVTNSGRYKDPLLARASLKMSASRSPSNEGEAQSFSIRKEPNFSQYPLGSMKLFESILKAYHATLPMDLTVTFSCPLFRPAKKRERPDPSQSFPAPPRLQELKPNTIDAAAATLASAAISGHVPDATIIGVLNAEGEFQPGEDFWYKIECLYQNPGEGKRLIVPTSAAPFMLALLALEQPQLFFNYEVISASNFSELLERSAAKLGEKDAAASAKFKEIRDKSLNQPTGQYVANPFIRRRLAELAVECPQHVSAKLLSLQGSGNRPTQVSRELLAPMLRKALRPVERMISDTQTYSSRDASVLLRIGDECRDSLDTIEPYVEKADLPFFLKAQSVVVALRAVERAARSYSRDFYGLDQLESAQKNLLSVYGDAAFDLGLKSENQESPADDE